MKQKKSLLSLTAEKASIEVGAMPRLPVVEIAGQKRVLIENHKGVLSYGCREICVSVSYGQIVVEGKGLVLGSMTRHCLTICGQIDAIRLTGRN